MPNGEQVLTESSSTSWQHKLCRSIMLKIFSSLPQGQMVIKEKQQWLDELKVMRDRINGNREILVSSLASSSVDRDFSFIATQKGMFSFLGINKDQVSRLKAEFSIYMVDSSRISIAGISNENVCYLATSIAKVL